MKIFTLLICLIAFVGCGEILKPTQNVGSAAKGISKNLDSITTDATTITKDSKEEPTKVLATNILENATEAQNFVKDVFMGSDQADKTIAMLQKKVESLTRQLDSNNIWTYRVMWLIGLGLVVAGVLAIFFGGYLSINKSIGFKGIAAGIIICVLTQIIQIFMQIYIIWFVRGVAVALLLVAAWYAWKYHSFIFRNPQVVVSKNVKKTIGGSNNAK